MNQPLQHGAAIVADLAILGVTVRADGNRLRIRPRSKLTPELLERVRLHKAEVIKVLHQQADSSNEGRKLGPLPSKYARFATVQRELHRRGFQILADKPEVVMALLAVAEEIAAKLSEGGRDE